MPIVDMPLHELKGHIIPGLDDAPESLLFRPIYLDTAQRAGIVMKMPEVERHAPVMSLGESSAAAGLTEIR